jgi:hypothetical protein
MSSKRFALTVSVKSMDYKQTSYKIQSPTSSVELNNHCTVVVTGCFLQGGSGHAEERYDFLEFTMRRPRVVV